MCMLLMSVPWWNEFVTEGLEEVLKLFGGDGLPWWTVDRCHCNKLTPFFYTDWNCLNVSFWMILNGMMFYSIFYKSTSTYMPFSSGMISAIKFGTIYSKAVFFLSDWFSDKGIMSISWSRRNLSTDLTLNPNCDKDSAMPLGSTLASIVLITTAILYTFSDGRCPCSIIKYGHDFHVFRLDGCLNFLFIDVTSFNRKDIELIFLYCSGERFYKSVAVALALVGWGWLCILFRWRLRLDPCRFVLLLRMPASRTNCLQWWELYIICLYIIL